jgi:hypothetical protein
MMRLRAKMKMKTAGTLAAAVWLVYFITARAVIVLALFFLAGELTDFGQTGADQQAILGVLRAYHAALEAGQPSKAVETLGPSYFMADERTGGSPRLAAHLFLTDEKLRAWPKAFLDEAGPYRNEFKTLSVSIRGDAAVVLTQDTGSNRFRKWKDEEIAWFLGRTAGQWRIVGLVIRDIQLPKKQ